MSISKPIKIAGAVTAAVAVGVLVVPAQGVSMAGLSRADRIRQTQLSEQLLGQFTPAYGDPRLIARYAQVSASDRSSFAFTPAVARDAFDSRGVTIVVRARPGVAASMAPLARASSLGSVPAAKPQQGSMTAVAPVAYRLGTGVGLSRFAAPAPAVGQGAGFDLAKLPSAGAPRDPSRRPSRFSAKAGSADEPMQLPGARTVDMTGSYRVTRNLDLTAGVRVKNDSTLQRVLPDERDDEQAVYVGTQFRF